MREELERRRAIFRERRDYLLPALRELGFDIPVTPEGAFYLYADCSRFTDDSERFARELLEQAGVAITPGRDFGSHRARQHVRFSTPPRVRTSKRACAGWRSIRAAADAESEPHDGAEMGRQVAVGDATQVAVERGAHQRRRLR